MRLALLTLAILLSACVHRAAAPCLTAPPPTLNDRKAECAGWNVKTETTQAINCALWRLNVYVKESGEWSEAAWRACGR